MTKPVGGGVVTTAAKPNLAPEAMFESATTVMCELNAEAATGAREASASAVTDVTGFGLLGHLHELCHGSGTSQR